MIELFVFGALALVGLVVFGMLAAVLSIVLWVITLPFRLLGLLFHGLGLLILLPFVLVGVLVAATLGLGFLMVPLAPLALIALAVWLLVRRGAPATSHP